MLRNILTFLILLCSVVLYEKVIGIESNTMTSVSSDSDTDTTGHSTLTKSTDTSTAQVKLSTSTDTSTTQPSNSTEEPIEEQQGLTSGQIAGVAVGSITGAAVLGGGLYAGLRYSGKLGG